MAPFKKERKTGPTKIFFLVQRLGFPVVAWPQAMPPTLLNPVNPSLIFHTVCRNKLRFTVKNFSWQDLFKKVALDIGAIPFKIFKLGSSLPASRPCTKKKFPPKIEETCVSQFFEILLRFLSSYIFEVNEDFMDILDTWTALCTES